MHAKVRGEEKSQTKVANNREKGNEVELNIEEGQEHNLRMSMPMMFPGLNREREMSAMISALTHVICGENTNNGADQKMDHTTTFNNPSVFGSAIPSSTSSSYGSSSSALKRRREDDRSFGSSPAIPPSKHQG